MASTPARRCCRCRGAHVLPVGATPAPRAEATRIALLSARGTRWVEALCDTCEPSDPASVQSINPLLIRSAS